jgi:dienelactone hydrolase
MTRTTQAGRARNREFSVRYVGTSDLTRPSRATLPFLVSVETWLFCRWPRLSPGGESRKEASPLPGTPRACQDTDMNHSLDEPAPARLDSLAFTLARYANVRPALSFDPARPDAWRAEARARLRDLIGPFPSDRERVPLNVRLGPERKRPGHVRVPITFATRLEMDACGYLLIPDGLTRPAPGMICLPGHGRGVDEIVGIDDEGRDRDHPDGYQHDFAVQCAQRGYVTLAIEPLGFGARRDPAARAASAGTSSCQPAAGAALLLGETMIGWRVWDTMRGLDLLQSRSDIIDPNRLGLMGISGGGTVSLYTAALDDRVTATMLSGSFCTVRDSIFSISHCIDNYVPGLLKWFETADLAGLIAPRGLFVEAGAADPIFPKPGVETALRQTLAIYEALGAANLLDHAVFDAGHQFDGASAFARLAEWLKPDKI